VKPVLGGLGAGLLGLSSPAAAQGDFLLANLPLYFEANQGQADAATSFIARGRDSQFLISPGESAVHALQVGRGA
jgi:hypothetical protein